MVDRPPQPSRLGTDAVAVMSERWAAFLDALLGPRCETCGERVFPRDRLVHVFADHADQWPEVEL